MTPMTPIDELLRTALEKLQLSVKHLGVEVPANNQFGDYSTNLALQLTKKLNKSPIEIAQLIKKKIPSSSLIEKVEIIKPGFINFWLSPSYLMQILHSVIQKKGAFGRLNALSGKKIMIEYTDPNPFKEFHIGHLYSNIVGESLARLHEAIGAEVKRACYQGDVGMHVAKSLWGLKKKLTQDKLTMDELEKKYSTPAKKTKYLGQAYALGATAYETDHKAKKEIQKINQQIYQEDPCIIELYKKGKKWSLDYFESIYQRLGTKFDEFFFESETGKAGLEYVKKNLDKGIFTTSQGAIIFPGEKYGLHTRVFVNSLGLPTYEAKDLGLAPMKYSRYPYDLSIIVTGHEVNAYFKVVLKALSLINPSLSAKTRHISHGMVRLPEGKISSRTGNIITGEYLIDAAKDKILTIMQNSRNDIPADQKPEIAEKIALAAVKYGLLKNNIGKDVEFRLNESISFEGNSGPYLQYTYVRCYSVLKKASHVARCNIDQLTLEKNESELLRLFEKFPFVIYSATKTLAPNLICNYLYHLAQKFNLFYQKHPIINAPEPKRQLRLTIVSATAQIIKNGLWLIGIETVEKM